MIIETTCNKFYFVWSTGSADLSHVWLGTEVKQDKKTGGWKHRPNRKGSGNRPQLVSKAHCLRVVSEHPVIG